MVMTMSANAMSYTAAKNEALFLSDKMAYELNLTASQYDRVYEINLDYLMNLNGRLTSAMFSMHGSTTSTSLSLTSIAP